MYNLTSFVRKLLTDKIFCMLLLLTPSFLSFSVCFYLIISLHIYLYVYFLLSLFNLRLTEERSKRSFLLPVFFTVNYLIRLSCFFIVMPLLSPSRTATVFFGGEGGDDLSFLFQDQCGETVVLPKAQG